MPYQVKRVSDMIEKDREEGHVWKLRRVVQTKGRPQPAVVLRLRRDRRPLHAIRRGPFAPGVLQDWRRRPWLRRPSNGRTRPGTP